MDVQDVQDLDNPWFLPYSKFARPGAPLSLFALLCVLCESQIIQLSVVSDEWLVESPLILHS